MSLILYEVRDRVAIITLNRPEVNNAQNPPLLAELDAAFDTAADDENVRVIVLNASGRHFSAGHDISAEVVKHEPWLSMFDDVDQNGLLRMYRWEAKHFLGYSVKWRNLPKPTIAAVQGACVSAGLMLIWPMDLIVAADNSRFADPVIHMAIGGVEYHGHTWEFGPRKAKEMLFTGRWMNAEEAEKVGMVNHVVPLDRLHDATLELATRIAGMHPHGLLMAKRAVNTTMDIIGQHAAIQACFETHSLGHANAWAAEGRVTLASLDEMTAANKKA